MKILVIGCNGMAGHVISLYLKERGHEVLGYAREKSKYIESLVGDVRNLELIRQIVAEGRFDSVINCVGLLNQFAEENHEAAVFVNSYFPHYLADITEGTNTQIIHMSTDCVFSGALGSYREDSLRDGKTFYDRSKALGELEDSKNVTLRNSIIGPDIKNTGIGLMNWFMQQNSTVNGFCKAIWTGQTTLQLAKTMEKVAEYKIHGLYNMVPEGSISKYELLQLFNRYIRKIPIEIVPREDFVADKSLIRTNFEGFDYVVPDYETMVIELGKWMGAHRELYPHYQIK